MHTWPTHQLLPLWLNQSLEWPAPPQGFGFPQLLSPPRGIQIGVLAQREWELQGYPSKMGQARGRGSQVEASGLGREGGAPLSHPASALSHREGLASPRL